MSLSSAATASKPRLYYLDWLRVLSMLTVFLYHSNRFFNLGDWHVKNAHLSQVSSVFENALGVFMMPLLFILSGAAIFYSLKSRGGGGFVKERFLRLMVPLVTLGMFLLGPLQIYLERHSHGDFSGSFWQFIPRYFDGLYGFDGNFAWMGVHLWYLMLLFLFAVILLPLFLPSRENGESLLSRISSMFDRPWALFMLYIPLALTPHLTDALDMGVTREFGGWDIFSYMLFLVYGYLLFSNLRIVETLRKWRFVTVIAAGTLTVFWLVIKYAVLDTPDTGFFFSAELKPLISWLWILGILGLGRQYLNANSRALSYTNEAVLPFYILHQPVLLLIGYFVVQWTLPVFAKYFIIAGISFVTIMTIYQLLVKRINVFRILFGMRLMERSKAASAMPDQT